MTKKPLSETEPLQLMISSRCSDIIQYDEETKQTMGVLRAELKTRLEAIKLGRKQVFKVWIHEDESNAGAIINDWGAEIHGPVHLIACQKGVSETQAIRQLGFPDAVVVTAPFGVYVADDVQKIQMAFIANCRDETTTRVNVQEFLNWLSDHGESKYLVQRAASRRKISDLIHSLS